MNPDPSVGSLGYQVVVSGLLAPALLASLSATRAGRTATTTVFRLRVPAHEGASRIAELLSARGLVVVSAREVPDDRS